MKVSLEDVTTVSNPGRTGLDGVSVAIEDGELLAVLGPAGCGGAALLRAIAGLETVTAGTVRFGDRDVTRLAPGKRDVAMVFDEDALFPHMTVADNIGYPLRVKKMGRAERRARAVETGARLSLGEVMNHRPADLSGGQRQRVALARAMAVRPAVFLLDEPLSALDGRMRLEGRTFLKTLQRELGATTVLATSDQAEALALADRIAVMGSGRLHQLGTPREVFGRPADIFAAGLVGSTPMNLLEGECVAGDGETATSWGHQIDVAGVRLPVPEEIVTELTPGDKVIVGIRPEYVIEAEDGIEGTVEIVASLGTSSLVTLTTEGPRVQLTVADGREPEPGARMRVIPEPGRMLVYRADDGELIDAP